MAETTENTLFIPQDGDMLAHERALWRHGLIVAGIDEAGRGCLAGPVVAAAVVLGADADLPGVTDSKQLSDRQRRSMLPLILEQARGVGVGVRSARRIDASDILTQTKSAMLRAVAKLPEAPDFLLIDGNQRLPTTIQQRTLIGGDGICLSIAAASIVAKVTRDDLMLRLHERYGDYAWHANKGYGTAEHLEALRRVGPCPLHRMSFRGVVRKPE
ncbi:MAG: ribonuclease HII [Candidatus Lernaella stagnicola]|nr:ribonuclease HII [Candidatus Lernaella stagnicola]